MENISWLMKAYKENKFKLAVIWFMVFLESGLFLLFPLLMGRAIDGLLEGDSFFVLLLVGTGVLTLIFGALRRFYDSRVYSGIYARISPEIVKNEKRNNSSVSTISARVNLSYEIVEFLENNLPDIINQVIVILGTIIIIRYLDLKIFAACMLASVLIGLVYFATRKKTMSLNSGFNSELENQVEVLAQNSMNKIKAHFIRVVRWNIRLSDLETWNFSLSWLILLGLLVVSLFLTVKSGQATQGEVLANLMYVFNFMESIIAIPLYYQQFLRLQEIQQRLGEVPEEAVA